MTPWKVRYSIGWSSVWTASRRFPATSGGPCGTANESSTPSCSSRTSQWSRVAWCRCTTYRGFAGAFRTVPFGSGVFLKSRLRWYSVKLTAYAWSGEGPMSSFADLADTFLKEEFAESPVQASSLGLTAYDEKLDDLSADAFRRHEERSASWLARFRALPDDSLSPAERIDRDFASSILRGRELTAARRNWQRQPATYLNPGLQGVFSLFLHKLRPENDLADAARAPSPRGGGAGSREKGGPRAAGGGCGRSKKGRPPGPRGGRGGSPRKGGRGRGLPGAPRFSPRARGAGAAGRRRHRRSSGRSS